MTRVSSKGFGQCEAKCLVVELKGVQRSRTREIADVKMVFSTQGSKQEPCEEESEIRVASHRESSR